ncbi:uncharacterized protein LOC129776608 [Toxorhynchites rutilus septentrionalis]|uniref:uncharacterized protein LOC129776608 n=1 Tax=Toxorhynchites rutilus septentrionalis TaxID=329112 RepID=UPI0024799472|nr:uncharacterized protein LOC129776608 [Toxorhynchites rutilus septentrionalis]
MSDEQKIHFLRNNLPKLILQTSHSNDELLSVEFTTPDQLDGFMSTIHKLDLLVRNTKSGEERPINLMVKVMKGDDTFRTECLSKIQFSNEIVIYTKVLPCFQKLLQTTKCSVTGDNWCPKVLYGTAGHIPEYSDQFETILVMENMTIDGFTSGPRNDLDEEHLTLMARKIAQFHACSYALKITNDKQLAELEDELAPLNFIKGEQVFESYAIVFKRGLERVFKYIDEHPESLDNEKFKKDIANLRDKYSDEPIRLMQKFLKRDEYSIILHGDYNRNNVLFKYEDGKPVDIRMFDFQEHRYGTPAIDLFFFMCMSMPTGLRERFWSSLLKEYYDSLMSTLTDILKCRESDKRLKPFQYDRFMEHLNRFALYGGMVAAHFLPWMLGSEEECRQLSYHFMKDASSAEMKRLTMVCGGEVVDRRLIEMLRHLSQIGCFSIVDEDEN